MKKILLLLVGLAVVAVVAFQYGLSEDQGYQRAMTRRAEAQARKAQVAAQVAADTAEAATFARQVVYVGGAFAFVVLTVGGAVAVVFFLSRRASEIRPTKGGQFPIVRVGGRAWAGYVDPNRAPTAVTLFEKTTGRAAQPTPLSEAATVALAGQATAAAMVAGATRYPSTSRANMVTAVDAVMKPATLSKPLPPVEVFDDADHVDRLLLMAGEVEEEA